MKEFDKKEAIYDAMLEMIAKYGFHNSPMSELAQKANVAAGTIYHHFKSKDEIICALFIRQKNKLNEVLFKNDDPAKSYKDRFRAFYFHLYEHFTKNPKEFTFLEQFVNSPFIQKMNKDDLHALDQPVYDFLRKAIFTQSLRDLSPKIMTALIMGSTSAVIKLSLSGEYQFSPSDLEAAFLTCWDGIKKV
jgi:AcrR family transcriptional regulator